MRRRSISPPSVFKSEVYGFSQGVLVEQGKKTLFISGQLAANAKGSFVGGSFGAQCNIALRGLSAVPKEA